MTSRLAFPFCYADPAFHRCLKESIETPELIENFDRLYGGTLTTRKSKLDAMVDVATGKQEADMKAFVQFVYDSIYLRLPEEALESLRA